MRRPFVVWVIAGILLVAVLGVMLPVLLIFQQGSSARQANGNVNSTALALAEILANYRHGSATALARAVDEQVPQSVLEAADDRHHRGATLIVRLSSNVDGGGLSGDASVTSCFRYDILLTGALPNPTEVPCPDSGPEVLPSLPPPPSLGDLTHSVPVAINALPMSERSNLAAVRSAVAGAVSVPEATITATATGSAIGIAVSLRQALPSECFFVRVTSAVQTWSALPVQSQPGEGGCTAEDAALGLDREPPH
jgi:hypothetical protein